MTHLFSVVSFFFEVLLPMEDPEASAASASVTRSFSHDRSGLEPDVEASVEFEESAGQPFFL